MNGYELGVASVTFRNKTVSEVVSIAKNANVGCIEWGADVHVKNLDDAKEAKRLCDSNDIRICSYGSYYRVGCGDYAEWENICKIAKELSASSIRVWLGTKDSEKTSDEEYEALLNEMRVLCDTADKYKLLVCPECHDNTFNNNTDAVIRMKKDLDRDNFKTYFQSRYFRFDYDIDRIERTFDFIENVHVSYRDLEREQMFRTKDKDYLDKLLRKLQQMNYGGIVLVEFTKGNKESNFIKDINKLRSCRGD